MHFFHKWWYIYKKKKELNENYSFSLLLAELGGRIQFTIGQNLRYKFGLILSVILLIILILDYIIIYSQAHTISVVTYLDSTILLALQKRLLSLHFGEFDVRFLQYLQLTSPDTDSARYFYSTVIQSLAALLAISFSVLLLYLQIGTDKYSIQTIKYTFSNSWAIVVISTFSITMIYSFFELCLIGNNPDLTVTPYNNISALIVVFILTVFCFYLLIRFIYATLSSLLPDNFIKENCNRIKKSFWLTLILFQDRVIYYQYLNEQIGKNENIELDSFFPSPDLQNPIRPIKYGLIQDIKIKKLDKCSKLLKKVSPDCKLTIYIPPNWNIKNKNFLLGNIECSDYKTVNKIEKLVKNAYKISNFAYILDEHTNFSPISAFITKMIMISERDISDKALKAYTDVAMEYIKSCKKLGLTENTSKVDNAVLSFNFINEFFKSLQRISKVTVDESDFESIDWILFYVREIGIEAINSLDSKSFAEILNFYFWFGYKFEAKFVDKIFLETDELSFQLYFDLQSEKENKRLIQKYGELLELTIDYDLFFANTLIIQQSNQSRRSLYKLLRIRRDLDEIWDVNEESRLKSKLNYLEKKDNEYHTITKNLEVIKQKKKLRDNFQLELDKKMYQFGIKLMLNLEKSKFTIEFTRSNLDIISEYFKLNDVDNVFKRITNDKNVSFEIEQQENEIEDYQAHILETAYYERFFILVKALLFKKYNILSGNKTVNIYTKQRNHVFRAQLDKLNKSESIWDTFFEGQSTILFNKVFEKIEEMSLEQEEVLQTTITKSSLSDDKVKAIISEIIDSAENTSQIRKYIKTERTNDFKGIQSVGIDISIDKIFLLPDVIDSTTHYDYLHLGKIIGDRVGTEESNYVINEIIKNLNIAERKLELESISFEELDLAKRELQIKGFNPSTIIASFDLKLKYKLYLLTQDSSKDSRYDWLEEVEIYPNGTLTEGVYVMFDKEHIGFLNIFEKLNPMISDKIDSDSIIKMELDNGIIDEDGMKERKKELDLMVNIRAFEKVKFEFGNPDAGIVVTTKS